MTCIYTPMLDQIGEKIMIKLSNGTILLNVSRMQSGPLSVDYNFNYSGCTVRYTSAQWGEMNDDQRTLLHELVSSGFPGLTALRNIRDQEGWRTHFNDCADVASLLQHYNPGSAPSHGSLEVQAPQADSAQANHSFQRGIHLNNGALLPNVSRMQSGPLSVDYNFNYSGCTVRYTSAQWGEMNDDQRTLRHVLVSSGFPGLTALRNIRDQEGWRTHFNDCADAASLLQHYNPGSAPSHGSLEVQAPQVDSAQANRQFCRDLAAHVVVLMDMGMEGVAITGAEHLMLADMAKALHALSQGSEHVTLPQHTSYNHNLRQYVSDHFLQLLGLAQRVQTANPTDSYLLQAANSILQSTERENCPLELRQMTTPEATADSIPTPFGQY